MLRKQIANMKAAGWDSSYMVESTKTGSHCNITEDL